MRKSLMTSMSNADVTALCFSPRGWLSCVISSGSRSTLISSAEGKQGCWLAVAVSDAQREAVTARTDLHWDLISSRPQQTH